ncbi:MAG: HNH endonuclease [Stigonema ocellatum SAG 48.90 = DSM 106950]|nr:HNH endonuclease [Stigonema ocellatum SAG 48.90 = DSM 106950]
MPRPYINLELRRNVANRADFLCEYCYVLEADRSSAYQIDHIISVKHGGATTADNLAYSCIFCNLQKGTDLGSINWRTGELVRFFNPRRDFWGEHFRLDEVVIQPQTEIGEVTVRIFDFNNNERIIERQALMAVSRFPSPSALDRMTK